MKNKHEIHGIDVRGINFGVKRNVLRKVSEKPEIEYFIETQNKLSRERFRRNMWWGEMNKGNPKKSNEEWHDLQNKISGYEDELKGYRKAWRCMWTDSMDHGLYTVNRKIPTWMLKKAVGKYGFGYARIESRPGDIFLYIGHDKKLDVELLHQKTNTIVKVPRGAGISDSLYKMEKKNEDI
tara:strand:+ start:122 stop:664 length:543 start_codon:yes stop_codon:yes gene_type:complete